MISLKTKKRLTPADFKVQLWFGVYDMKGRHMLPREPIEWGQRFISIKITEPAKYIGGAIFDRPEGGESIGNGLIEDGPICLKPGENINLSMKWNGK